MHWHRHDYIYVALGGGEIVNAVKDQPPVTTKVQDGETRFASAPFAHTVHNQTDQHFRKSPSNSSRTKPSAPPLLREMSSGTKTAASTSSPKAPNKSSSSKTSVRVTEFELQPGGVIPLHHHAGPLLVVALTDYEIAQRHQRQGRKPAVTVSMKAGQSKWIPGGYSHTLTNSGPKPAKYVTLEFPPQNR